MALTRVLFVVLVKVALWEAGVSAQEDDCQPSCPTDCTPGDKVPNPVNCRQYYECLEDCVPSDPVFECPDGTLFDNDAGECKVDDGNVTCGTCTPPCKFTCTDGYEGLIADRENCQLAYLCMFDPPLVTSCGTGLYFDGTSCQEDQALCCDPCQVYCETAYIEIMDPTDCTAYYYCSQEGWPLPEDRYQCDEGEMFVEGHCQATQDPAECHQPCAGTTTGTSTFTSTTVTSTFTSTTASTTATSTFTSTTDETSSSF